MFRTAQRLDAQQDWNVLAAILDEWREMESIMRPGFQRQGMLPAWPAGTLTRRDAASALEAFWPT